MEVSSGAGGVASSNVSSSELHLTLEVSAVVSHVIVGIPSAPGVPCLV